MAKVRISDSKKWDNKWDVINRLSVDDLYSLAKSGKDALDKRVKRLGEAISKEPTKYSPFGYREMTDGKIPTVSKKMSQAELRTAAKIIVNLYNMDTGTVTGARKVQQMSIRNSLGIPTEGRMSKKDREKYDQAVDFYEKNPDALSKFWEGFQIFKDESRHLGLDSNRLKEEYIKRFDTQNLVVKNLSAIRDEIQDEVDRHYKELQKKNNLLGEIEQKGGWNLW